MGILCDGQGKKNHQKPAKQNMEEMEAKELPAVSTAFILCKYCRLVFAKPHDLFRILIKEKEWLEQHPSST